MARPKLRVAPFGGFKNSGIGRENGDDTQFAFISSEILQGLGTETSGGPDDSTILSVGSFNAASNWLPGDPGLR